ncbi:Tetratricopeptide repeat-containing protein [Filimonas lacunae]|uniref:Regulator of microtubule dynamics protein 1 n=1 Tax=Filimonas lacunae TaxID=477680 RepID=A0A173MFN1_9BACT|nr:hypothetical protein [Filimonas lacunae]BAV06393.1 TPR repeat [Filimonas lacunae]SIT26782.1 Tetratricopeptide repeat-containing protein [Filimonas lacunae]
MIKKNLAIALFSLVTFQAALAQDATVTLKEAENLEKQLKEDAALEKFKSVAIADSTNITALLKTAELSCATGGRIKDIKARKPSYDQALTFATRAYNQQPENAQVNYIMSLVSSKMPEVEEENKKLVQYIKQTKEYADKALAINPNHGKANYMVGKWNLEMLNMNWFKKAAAKTLYGGSGMQKPSLDTAITYMEKCRTLEPYFVQNYLDLAKAYKQDNKPAKSIEVLNKLVKLPSRTQDDIALKAEGKALLDATL